MIFNLLWKSELNFESLVVEIQLNDVGLNTCVWLKPTNTRCLLNFYAICRTTRKSGLITCFFHRAKYISSTLKLHKQEKLKNFQLSFQETLTLIGL